MQLLLNISFIFSLVILTCGKPGKPNETYTGPEATIDADSIQAIGIWEIPKEERYISGKTAKGNNWSAGPPTEIFNYDGKYVTLWLFTEKAWMWKTPDDHYKLNSKWGHDTLYYLPPFGRWEPLAVYNGSAFTSTWANESMSHTWTFKKISPNQLEIADTAIVKDRKPHDYSIRPMDTYKE